MRYEVTIHAVVDARDEQAASDITDTLLEKIKKDMVSKRDVVSIVADNPEPVEEDDYRDEDYERAAARARGNDFEDTDGKDWT